ncbi:SMI1/KNR4 family protein [Parasedimentitalea maritima]|uniref:SMI1/KNR4 family protein n=1 Tax=Parasedimentitalea maritima TaxID=2578117 RepID=UPI00131E2EA7|nr:SMI1/KNR4 family protein [Zongyanglinia marina]
MCRNIGCPEVGAPLEEIQSFERVWEVEVPRDLVAFWETYGSGSGWASDEDDTPYLKIYSPNDALLSFDLPEIRRSMPSGFAPLGDDGAGEMIVLFEGRGFGFIGLVHSGVEDFVLVAKTLEEFFAKTERDEWFP